VRGIPGALRSRIYSRHLNNLIVSIFVNFTIIAGYETCAHSSRSSEYKFLSQLAMRVPLYWRKLMGVEPTRDNKSAALRF
jgi:hypothetical protein